MTTFRSIVSLRQNSANFIAICAISISAIGFTLSTARAQVVYVWRPFQSCASAGKCLSATGSCSGPLASGKKCLFCSKTLPVYECVFDLFENCYEEFEPTPNCGGQLVGNCDGAGSMCINGVFTGLDCPRPNCY